LLVTTYGVPTYAAADLASSPASAIVSQFKLTPTADSIIGTQRGDRLHGTDDDDVIIGAGGKDCLAGGKGNDYLDGGHGRDVVHGGDGNDHIFGRGGKDWLFGQDGDDRIAGGDGRDRAFGGNGSDTFIAEICDGNDLYFGGCGTDTLDLTATGADASVSLKRGTAASADIGHDRLFSVENVLGGAGADHLAGGNGQNHLSGGGGDDALNGGRGSDLLDGGIGNDILTGGEGTDAFRFSTPLGAANLDLITDFDVFEDTIQLENAVFAKLTATGSLAAGNFSTGAALDGDDFILYDAATGGLFYDADGSGAGAQVQFALLKAGLEMTNDDFLVT
jgi:Ca2+-binding RTX toxin-like protein